MYFNPSITASRFNRRRRRRQSIAFAPLVYNPLSIWVGAFVWLRTNGWMVGRTFRDDDACNRDGSDFVPVE